MDVKLFQTVLLSINIDLTFFLLCPITLTNVQCQINLTPLFSIFACKSKVSSAEYIIKKRRKKGCYITFAKSNCLDGSSFGYSSKLTGLLLKTTKRLFQLLSKSVKTVESKGQRRLNSFKKRIPFFSNTSDFVFKVLPLLMITKHLQQLFILMKHFPCRSKNFVNIKTQINR